MSYVSEMKQDSSIDYSKYNEEPWKVIESYFEGAHLKQCVRHQLESYNDFVQVQIPRTIAMFNPLHVKSENDYVEEVQSYRLEMYITFDNFGIHRAQIHENNGATKLMFPNEARLRNFTYASNMVVDMNIKYVVRTGEKLEYEQCHHNKIESVHIGKLPIMLKSSICVLEHYKHIPDTITGECFMDPGGYFIINGSEKTCLGQERAAENRIQCFNISKNNTKWKWMAEIKSVPDFKCISPKQITMYVSSKNNGFGHTISIQIPRIKVPIPLFIVFRAIGVNSDKDITKYIVLNTDCKSSETQTLMECLRASVVEASSCMTKEEALVYIINQAMYTPLNVDRETGIKRKRDFTLGVLTEDLFPHCRTEEQKKYFLGHMSNMLLRCSLGWNKPDDRDSYLNKRVDLTGTLLNNLFL